MNRLDGLVWREGDSQMDGRVDRWLAGWLQPLIKEGRPGWWVIDMGGGGWAGQLLELARCASQSYQNFREAS